MAEDKAVVADGKMVNMATTITIVGNGYYNNSYEQQQAQFEQQQLALHKTSGKTCKLSALHLAQLCPPKLLCHHQVNLSLPTL